MDSAQLAQQTIDTLRAGASEAAKVLAEKAPGAVASGAVAVWAWLKGKFTKPAAAGALQEAVQQPTVEENWDALRIQILKAIKEDEAFARELQDLLPQGGDVAKGRQTATTIGNDNAVAQVTGQGNQTNIGRR